MNTDEEVIKLKSKVSRLYTHLGLEEDPPPPPSTLPLPRFLGSMLFSSTGDHFAFNPQIYKDGKYLQYCIKDGRVWLAISSNGVTGWVYYPTNAPAGSIRYENGIWLGNAHRWIPGIGLAETLSYGSEDGTVWSQTALDRNQTCGEDRNLLWDQEAQIWRCYIRIQPKPRAIGYMESRNGRIWTMIRRIITPPLADELEKKQYYHVSVIKTPMGYFGLLNVYRVGNAGQDVEQAPPYTAQEHTIQVYLIHSTTSDFTLWRKLNNAEPFLKGQSTTQQQFAWWSVIGDKARIVDAVSDRKHTTYENQNVNGRYYSSGCWEIALTDLYQYL